MSNGKIPEVPRQAGACPRRPDPPPVPERFAWRAKPSPAAVGAGLLVMAILADEGWRPLLGDSRGHAYFIARSIMGIVLWALVAFAWQPLGALVVAAVAFGVAEEGQNIVCAVASGPMPVERVIHGLCQDQFGPLFFFAPAAAAVAGLVTRRLLRPPKF